MSYNFKLIVRNGHNEEILDLIDLSSQIKLSDIKLDLKTIEGNKYTSIKSGIGIISSGRKLDFAIPIFEYKDNLGKWVKIESQYTKYTTMILSNNSNRYFIRIEFENEIYEAEYIMTSVGGYTVKYINNLGVINISLESLDKTFLRQKEDTYKLNITNDSKQDIYYKSLSLVPTAVSFSLEFNNIIGDELYFLFANKQNFGIEANIKNINFERCIVDFNREVLKVNGVIYDYKGIRPELNVGDNIFYLDTNQTCTNAYIRYRRGVLI